ncbi:hypothetical protein CHLNCDRAFT_57546 [Chlorella variabilis]|uniref:RRM domain-containing protein n=1 Tax=Chlorella variabilis TaxID=554065 RepID=E1ZBK8_CHLVA|nr:hypothetical protein CHLNCDRAFT_57546 [Chlorella variabilis]EFN56661.1 hypothetical protein CHLNCDRAFT_57546 [Chlorella variabilis]|eukprot:XP_005848763.1 hypothetical protein CHLNCDRAFT_57546 [Chlorella variabilis]
MAAEAALNKSLDDLIAEQRQKKDTKTQKKEVRRGNKPGGDRPGPGGSRAPKRVSGGGPPPRREPRNLSITVKGGVGKRVSAGGGVREEREREDPQRREAALEGGAKWGHDMYRGPVGGGGGGGGARRGPRDPTPLGTKLGRSEGTAEVIFEDAGHAERAMRKYNNVQLDGNAMQIELIPQAAPSAGGGAGGPRTLSSGIRISGERGGTRMVQLTRHFQQAAGGATRVRGRGSVRSGVMAMQE